jgi:type IV pilus assembly protein PilX
MRKNQNGAVLIVSLLILILLTLLGLTAIQAGTVQERIVGNTRNLDLAFQAAEAALREAEDRLDNPSVPLTNGSVTGWYHWSLAPAPAWRAPATWDSAGNIDYTLGSDAGWNVARAPEFAIEELPPMPDTGGSLDGSAPVSEDVMYRIHARGFGGNENTFVILQATYRR